jgi:N-acylneuraminate cytidylyltransferase
MPSALALIPSRGGSLRVPNKNIRRLKGHPLIAYAIASARASGLYDRIVVSTDSERIREIALYYGAEAPFLRPAELATSVSIDVEWIKHALTELGEEYDTFSILRPTSPFRRPETIRRAWERLQSLPGVDSVRAVELVQQHPGKMWMLESDETMRPLLDQSHLEIPWHAGQYQALPKVYVQNSALEMAWTRVVWEHNSREGRVVAPFFTDETEGFTIDYESDWYLAEKMAEGGEGVLGPIDQPPYPGDV